jgi:hypothetical protein
MNKKEFTIADLDGPGQLKKEAHREILEEEFRKTN